jgi:hypothetical protein
LATIRTRWAVIGGGIVALAAALRLHAIAYQSLTDDEGYSLALAQRPFGLMLHLFKFESNGVLYSLILWPMTHGEDSARLLRLPAAIAGIAAVCAMYWAGRELAGRRAALVATLLLAVNPMAVRYSQFARPFTFVLLFTLLSFACLARGLRRNQVGWLAGYAVCLVGATYSNTLAPLMLLPPQFLIVWRADRAVIRRWVGAVVAAGVALLPLAYLAISESTRRDALYWLGRPTPILVAHVGEEFLLARASTTVTAVAGAAVIASLAIVILLVRGAWSARSELFRRSALAHPAAVATAWAGLPFVVAVLISIARPIFFGAYLIEALPGVCLLLAICAVSVPGRLAIGAVSALAAAWLVASLAMSRPPPFELDYRDATTWLRDHRDAGEPILIDPISRLPGFAYYSGALRTAEGRIPVKEWHDAALPEGVVGLTDPGGYGDAPPGPPSVALVRALTARRGEMLAAFPGPIGQGDVEQSAGVRWLERVCDVRSRSFGEITVLAASGCRRGSGA